MRVAGRRGLVEGLLPPGRGLPGEDPVRGAQRRRRGEYCTAEQVDALPRVVPSSGPALHCFLGFFLLFSRAVDPPLFFEDPDPAVFLNADADPNPQPCFTLVKNKLIMFNDTCIAYSLEEGGFSNKLSECRIRTKHKSQAAVFFLVRNLFFIRYRYLLSRKFFFFKFYFVC